MLARVSGVPKQIFRPSKRANVVPRGQSGTGSVARWLAGDGFTVRFFGVGVGTGLGSGACSGLASLFCSLLLSLLWEGFWSLGDGEYDSDGYDGDGDEYDGDEYDHE
jgi:hypothetical protein